MIAAEAEAAGGAISAKFSSAAPSSIFLERNAPGGGVSPSEGGVQVVSRETSQQILSLFGVRGCSKWKYDVVENGGQPSSLHVLFVGPRVFLLYIDQCHCQQEAGL